MEEKTVWVWPFVTLLEAPQDALTLLVAILTK